MTKTSLAFKAKVEALNALREAKHARRISTAYAAREAALQAAADEVNEARAAQANQTGAQDED